MCSRFRKVYHSSKETFEWYLNRDKRKEKKLFEERSSERKRKKCDFLFNYKSREEEEERKFLK